MAQLVGTDETELSELGRSWGLSLQRIGSSFRSNVSVLSAGKDDDEESALQWAAIDRLPTFERLRSFLFDELVDKRKRVIDVTKLGALERHMSIEKLIKHIEHVNLRLLKKIRKRIHKTLQGFQVFCQEYPRSASLMVLVVTGDISYNRYKLTEFVRQKTSAYISQYDLHTPEMTVRETLDFSLQCQGVGSRSEIVAEVSRREKYAAIVPDPDAISVEGPKTTLRTDYILKILGLNICAETLVGDAMRRGNVLEFFESCGFKCPERKGIANFFREVISDEDQAQYWYSSEEAYSYISIDAFSRKFKEFSYRKKLAAQLSSPLVKSKSRKDAMSFSAYSLPKCELFRACISRDFLLMKRNSFIFIFKSIRIFFNTSITVTVFLRTNMHADLLHANYYMGALNSKEIAKSLSSPPIGSKALDFPTHFAQNGWGQFKACLWKQHLSYWRSPSYILVHFTCVHCFSGFWGIVLESREEKFLPFVSTEQAVLYRERFAGMYASWAYALSQVIIEIPYVFVQSLIFMLITYPMIGYYWSASKVFWYI
ncbi:hypothetical protein ACH5RR_001647 [Cinchona calisaya]|uniref:ABC-2 type transporter transmembrane domain-containing protein n=1 Tax=Cinchona calisaya TaxID=153742 RepID=A0ABD3B4M9_9GENT